MCDRQDRLAFGLHVMFCSSRMGHAAPSTHSPIHSSINVLSRPWLWVSLGHPPLHYHDLVQCQPECRQRSTSTPTRLASPRPASLHVPPNLLVLSYDAVVGNAPADPLPVPVPVQAKLLLPTAVAFPFALSSHAAINARMCASRSLPVDQGLTSARTRGAVDSSRRQPRRG